MNPFVIAALAALLLLAACATRPPLPRETAQDAFVIEQDLVGRTTARGEFRAINGVRRGFTAHLDGAWDGRTFTLVEDFEFDDGQRDRKTWRLERVGPGEYVGTREDVVGQARGYQDGRAFRLEYDVRLTNADGSPGRKVRFRDVMVLTPEGAVLNRANVGLWGLRVAQVELTIERAAAAAAVAAE
ncbi:DUF3833 family protein [Vitreimonas sp.]|uniref:DUF3833 family protein n=1 Tax=Vitreimonas sp. TaxID=3069702 RepID=UPI002EDB78B1